MDLNLEIIEKVAKNSRLELNEKEKEKFLLQLKEILEAFSVVDEVNVENLPASFQPILIKDVFREDKVENSLSQEEALKNAIHKKGGYFKGPKVF